jgi:trans-AT polyketide synthase/acyltransferase/oxidoreductase domain-containing protein
MKKMIWMFAGQGTQYFQMGMELYENEPVFRRFMEEADRLLRDLLNESVVEVIYRQRANRFDPFHRLLHTHPAILMFECAIAEVLLKRGIRPDYLLGYSLGEYTCLVVSGTISFEDALITLVKQAELVEYCVPRGQMLAILDSPDLVDRFPDDFRQCAVAAYNTPRNFVVSGLTGDLKQLQQFLKGRGILFVELPVDYPFHSPQIDRLKTISEAVLNRVSLSPPKIPIITAEEGGFLHRPSAKHMWDVTRNPVDFAKTVRQLEASGSYLYVDLGPSGSMATAVKYNLPRDSQSELVTVSSPFGHEGKNLESLLEKRTPSFTNGNNVRDGKLGSSN